MYQRKKERKKIVQKCMKFFVPPQSNHPGVGIQCLFAICRFPWLLAVLYLTPKSRRMYYHSIPVWRFARSWGGLMAPPPINRLDSLFLDKLLGFEATTGKGPQKNTHTHTHTKKWVSSLQTHERRRVSRLMSSHCMSWGGDLGSFLWGDAAPITIRGKILYFDPTNIHIRPSTFDIHTRPSTFDIHTRPSTFNIHVRPPSIYTHPSTFAARLLAYTWGLHLWEWWESLDGVHKRGNP